MDLEIDENKKYNISVELNNEYFQKLKAIAELRDIPIETLAKFHLEFILDWIDETRPEIIFV